MCVCVCGPSTCLHVASLEGNRLVKSLAVNGQREGENRGRERGEVLEILTENISF